MNKLLLVGLGNPDKQFFHTRHNLGIELLQWWVKYQSELTGSLPSYWQEHTEFKASVASFKVNRWPISALFPLTFMNDSGKAVKLFTDYYQVALEHIVVIHDDLELQPGEVKFDEEGGAARGHNGVKSIQQELGTQEFARLRLGIGRPHNNLPVDQFVLQQFSSAQYEQICSDMKPKVAEALTEFISRRSPE